MTISGIVKSSLIDYPGFISCVLFVPGCNFNCFYCHNRSLIDGSHDVLEAKDIETFLKKRVGLLDGVVITGGEPTLQSGLIPYVHMLKTLGYKIKLDTNGSSPQMIERLLKANVCDYFAVDYKAPSEKYAEFCGESADAKSVLETIHLLLNYKVDFEVRTTVIPQLKEADLIQMARELPIVPRYILNRYIPPDKFLPCDKEKIEEKPYTNSHIIDFKDLIRSIQPNTF